MDKSSIVKYLVIGDPHFKTSNIPDIDVFITQTLELVKLECPDLIIVLGDVLHEHERLHTIPLNKAYDFIKSLAVSTKTFILVGNHDMINNQQFLNSNHWMNAMKSWSNVIIVDTPQHHYINDTQFITLCPYVSNGRFREALDTTIGNSHSFDWKQSIVIFAHQEFKGCKMGAIESQTGDEWSLDLPPVISGHIHHNQILMDGHIYYPGAAMQHAYGDPKNVLVMIEFENSSDSDQIYNKREIDLNMKKKRIVYKALEDIDQVDLSKLMNGDDIKLTLRGNYDDFKIFRKTQKYKELSDAGIKIVHKNIVPIATDTSDPLSCNSDNPTGIFSSQNTQTFQELIYNSIIEKKNDMLLIDFNHIFLGADIDDEILLL